jgi:serine phosphatase RsbU (regulator of sigma subunit)
MVVFFLFRPVIDFHSGAPLETHPAAASDRATEVLVSLGARQTSEKKTLVSRTQWVSLYTTLLDSLGKSQTLNPAALNASGVPLSGWTIIFAEEYEQSTGIFSDDVLFDDIGHARISLDQQGRVRSLEMHPTRNQTLIAGFQMQDVFDTILTSAGYTAGLYSISEINGQTFDLEGDAEFLNTPGNGRESVTVRFQREAGPGRNPELVEIEFIQLDGYVPGESLSMVRFDAQSDAEPPPIQIKLNSLRSFHPIEAGITITDSEQNVIYELVLYLAGFIVIVLIVLVMGVRLIFRGEVIWYRASVIFGFLTVLYLVNRLLTFFNTYYTVLDAGTILLDLLFFLFYVLFMATIVSLAYLAWDAYGRRQNQEQIPHIDALWNGNVFQQKIGKAVVAGYGYAGLSLIGWATCLYYFDIVFYQYDGFAGFTTATSLFPVLSLFSGSLLYAPLITYVCVGLMVSMMQTRINNIYVLVPLASLLLGFLMANAFPFVSSTGTLGHEVIAYSILAVPLILAFRFYGVITVAVAVWVMYFVVRIGLFLGSPDPVIANQGYTLLVILLLPFMGGLVLHHFGRDDLIQHLYVPEYEQKVKQQLRLEREFQIAKESQFALMPKSAPELEQVDVKGFFIPSFDVGGDFYDHIVVRNKAGEPQELMLTVVDVSGKAMKAALTAIFASGLLLSRSRNPGMDPAVVLSDANPILCERTDSQSFTTCLLARYVISDRMLHFVNAGHCKPILKRNGKAVFLDSLLPRLPLGVRREVAYKTTSVQLLPGDLLMMYSDGLPEARSKSGDQYEFETVLQALEGLNTSEMTSASICDYFKQEVLTFSDYELSDDMTLLVLKIR